MKTPATMKTVDVRIQEEPFDAGLEMERLRAADRGIGALATFVGVVRDLNDDRKVSTLRLEHYAGMTERAILEIVHQAGERWHLLGAIVVHRVGEMQPSDQIVLVTVASAHRGAAFEACEFIMDYLKTRAPFWKKEAGGDGERWIASRESDDAAAARWDTPS